jgi:hypothetical protein
MPAAGDHAAFHNTAFVVGPDGDVIFEQAKSVPIQFFNDGRPATSQRLWDSPWGRIGRVTILGVQACACAVAAAAWSAELSKDYLAGSWGVGGVAACGTPDAEHLNFNPDGTFGATHDGKATAVGFWFLVQDHLDLHMITSPAFFDDPATTADDALNEFAGQYTYLYAKALIFDAEQDSFRAVAAMGNMLRGANYRRCP